MNMQRRFGVLTAIAGAALALGSLTFGGSATATGSSNDDEHHNITTCPTGTTQFDGQEESGSGSEVLFHWAVTDDTYVTITQIDPTVTGLTAYIKGGDDYSTYSPVVAGVQMQSPDNGGGNVPELSHWFLCYTITPLVTTTTATTIPVVPGPNYIETSYTASCGTTTITLHNVSPWIYPVSVWIDGVHSYGPTVDNRTNPPRLDGPQKDATKSRTITFLEDSGVHTVSFVVNAGSENDLYMNLPVGTMTTYSVGSDCIPPETTTTTIPAPVYSYNLTSMCRPSETEGSLRVRNGSPTDQAYTLALYGGETQFSGTAVPGDTLVTVPWSSGGDTWILTIDGQTKTKAIGNNLLCETSTTTTTTVPEVVTTTTIGESETPTTTIVATTTTEIASEGPTTTIEQASEGPTTTLLADAGGDLPTTGGGASLPLVLGLAMTLGGVLFTLLARTPRES